MKIKEYIKDIILSIVAVSIIGAVDGWIFPLCILLATPLAIGFHYGGLEGCILGIIIYILIIILIYEIKIYNEWIKRGRPPIE